MCRAVDSVTKISNENIEIALLAQPDSCDKVLPLTGPVAKELRDTMGNTLANNLAVNVYWGPEGEVKFENRLTPGGMMTR